MLFSRDIIIKKKTECLKSRALYREYKTRTDRMRMTLVRLIWLPIVLFFCVLTLSLSLSLSLYLLPALLFIVVVVADGCAFVDA